MNPPIRGYRLYSTCCASWQRQHLQIVLSLVPRPHPAFRRLQYGKAGRAWYLFSHEHDVIGNKAKVQLEVTWYLHMYVESIASFPTTQFWTICSKTGEGKTYPCLRAAYTSHGYYSRAAFISFRASNCATTTYLRMATIQGQCLIKKIWYAKAAYSGQNLGVNSLNAEVNLTSSFNNVEAVHD